MIFDAILSEDKSSVTLSVALEDYDHEPWFSCDFKIEYRPSPKEGHDNIPTLVQTAWMCNTKSQTIFASPLERHKPPRWADRLAFVLRDRIKAMLLTGLPRDLRRWIDDELIDTIANELEVPNDEPVI